MQVLVRPYVQTHQGRKERQASSCRQVADETTPKPEASWLLACLRLEMLAVACNPHPEPFNPCFQFNLPDSDSPYTHNICSICPLKAHSLVAIHLSSHSLEALRLLEDFQSVSFVLISFVLPSGGPFVLLTMRMIHL